MNIPPVDGSLSPQTGITPSLPWSLGDTWIGLGLLVLIEAVILILVLVFKPLNIYGTFTAVVLEMAYVIPAVVILAVRGASWKFFGFHKFDVSSLGLGCGLVVASYFISLINNIAFHFLGQKLQVDLLLHLMGSLQNPYWLVFSAVIVAPLVEECFFRGFLFAGFRQAYGWNRAALLSSLVFAIGHMELAALIPTFLLGYIFSYIYHRSNSIWPGVILHFLVNAFGMIAILLSLHFGYLTPR
jgi:uncharacterized protein